MSSATSTAGPLGALALGVDLAHDAVLATVRGVHEAVGTRVHGRHGRVAGLVYDGVGSGMRAAARGLRAADRVAVGSGWGSRLEDTPRGRFALATLNGLFGDRIHEQAPDLAITMAVRQGGRDVDLDPDSLRAAFPDATARVVVFLHGLAETEDVWRRGAEKRGGTYGSVLADRLGWTPVYVRANSGLTLAENGAALASLLGDLVAGWPQPRPRVALVGHSMGGLVVRAACALAGQESWTEQVSDVVTIGTPHLGAPIARALTAGAAGLSLLPESAPFGRFLDHRSAGILDLRDGLPRDVVNLPHARYHLVGGTVSHSPSHPAAAVAGDLLVRFPSAVGRSASGREMFPGADVLHVPGADHFALLNHDDVAEALCGWLGEAL